jgi:hypothetical protein
MPVVMCRRPEFNWGLHQTDTIVLHIGISCLVPNGQDYISSSSQVYNV